MLSKADILHSCLDPQLTHAPLKPAHPTHGKSPRPTSQRPFKPSHSTPLPHAPPSINQQYSSDKDYTTCKQHKSDRQHSSDQYYSSDKQYSREALSLRQPNFGLNSSEPVNSWLEHCKLSSKQTSASAVLTGPHPTSPGPFTPALTVSPALTVPYTTAPSPTAPPAGLIEVRPNVWIPASALQQAQGDFHLAVHIAGFSQGNSLSQTDRQTGLSLRHGNGLSQTDKQTLLSMQPDSPSAGPFKWSTCPSPYGDPAQTDQQLLLLSRNPSYTPQPALQQEGNFASTAHFVHPVGASCPTPLAPRADAESPMSHVSYADNKSGSTTVAEPHPLLSTASKYLPGNQNHGNFNNMASNSKAATGSFNTAPGSCMAAGGNYNPAGTFMSPAVISPVSQTDPSNSFISPQCVLDNHSLFSYNLHADPPPGPSTSAWYAKPDNTPYQGMPQHSYSPAFDTGAPMQPLSVYNTLQNFNAAPAFQGQQGFSVPDSASQMYIGSDGAVHSGNAYANAYAYSHAWNSSAMYQPEHSPEQSAQLQHTTHSNLAPHPGDSREF